MRARADAAAWRLATSALLAAGAATLGTPVAAQTTLAIVDVDVIPMSGETVLERQTVLIQGGRIRAVGPAADVSLPDDAQRIDGHGRFLIPGLADMHVHPGAARDLDLLLANGVTFVRIMAGQPEFLTWRDEIARGERLGPRLYVAGPIIEGTPPPELAAVIPTDGKVLTDSFDDAAAAVARQAEAGYDFIKVYNNLPLVAYDGVLTEASRQGLPVAGHIPFEVGLFGALDAGQASIEHLRGYVWELVPADAPEGPGADLRSRTLAWRHADPALTRELASHTASAGVWNVPTLSTRLFKLPRTELDVILAEPESDFMPAGLRMLLEDRSRIGWLSNFSERDFVLAKESDRVQDALIRRLQDEGAGVLAGTDIAPWGFSLHRELEMLTDAGLTPFEALGAATANPARFLGEEGDWGVIAEGAEADLVLLGANPLEDISATRAIVGVVVAGHWLGRGELDRLIGRP